MFSPLVINGFRENRAHATDVVDILMSPLLDDEMKMRPALLIVFVRIRPVTVSFAKKCSGPLAGSVGKLKLKKASGRCGKYSVWSSSRHTPSLKATFGVSTFCHSAGPC